MLYHCWFYAVPRTCNYNMQWVRDTGYTFLRKPRGGRGGGVAILLKSGFSATLETVACSFAPFKHVSVKLSLDNLHVSTVVIVCRPPSLPTALFFQEFATICEQYAVTRSLIMVGDFNFHMDNSSDFNARKLASLLESMDLHQYVTGPTHQNGHTLDLLIPRVSDNIVLASSVATADFISDHCAIVCHLQVPTPKPTKRFIQYRVLKCIHHAAFQEDLLQSSLFATLNQSLTALLTQYSILISPFFWTNMHH